MSARIVWISDKTRSVVVNGKEFRMIDAVVDVGENGQQASVSIEIDVDRIVRRMGFGAASSKGGKSILASGAIVGRRIKR